MFESSIYSNKPCFYDLVLKKNGKTFNNSYFWTLSGQQWEPGCATSKMKINNSFLKWNKEIISFQILFVSSKYYKFSLNCEWFSCLNDTFLQKENIFLLKWLCQDVFSVVLSIPVLEKISNKIFLNFRTSLWTI